MCACVRACVCACACVRACSTNCVYCQVVSRPQVDRISQLHGLLSNAMPLDYLQHVEPKLEGLTPSLDLSLFREAESKTRLSFVSAYTLTTRLMTLVITLPYMYFTEIQLLYHWLVKKALNSIDELISSNQLALSM